MTAKNLLKIIGKTNEASIKLTNRYAKAAAQLVHDGLAIFIPISTGGAYVALTKEGLDRYEKDEY